MAAIELSDQMMQELKSSFDLFDEKQTGMCNLDDLARQATSPDSPVQSKYYSITDAVFFITEF